MGDGTDSESCLVAGIGVSCAKFSMCRLTARELFGYNVRMRSICWVCFEFWRLRIEFRSEPIIRPEVPVMMISGATAQTLASLYGFHDSL
jgi:hypothetical protein